VKRLKKTLVNAIAIALMGFVLMSANGLFFSAESAHRASESGLHYGPSEVVHVQDFGGVRHFLCRYDSLISCDTIHRTLGIFWRKGNHSFGYLFKEDKPMDCIWDSALDKGKIYGKVQDARIVRIEATLSDGQILQTDRFYDGLFLLLWEGKGVNPEMVRAYDQNGAVIAHRDFP